MCFLLKLLRVFSSAKKKKTIAKTIFKRHQMTTFLLRLHLHSLRLLSVSTFVSCDSDEKVKVNAHVQAPCAHIVCL